MKVLLKQVNKELFSANFELLEDDKIIGTLFLKGSLGSPEVKLTGKIYDKEFSMKRSKGSKGKFRPYAIIEDNNIVGEVYQAEIKTGFFSYKAYRKCIYKAKEYNTYDVAILDNKCVNSTYYNDSQIAQYYKDTTIYNDLYNFEIYCQNSDELFIIVITAIYAYITGFYKAGEKRTQSVTKYKSKHVDFPEKYNPDWIKQVKQN